MSLRCNNHPTSSIPLAIARLPTHRWIICQRGYANVVANDPDISHQTSHPTTTNTTTSPPHASSTTYGLLYALSPPDEAILDLYEGHDTHRNPYPTPNPDPTTRHERPFLQGEWDYNKHYLPLTITKWLQPPGEFGIEVPPTTSGSGEELVEGKAAKEEDVAEVRALVYVDELRTNRGRINAEYIGRMNRGIREAVGLGLPEEWVGKVLRRDVSEGVEVDEWGYVGRREGFVEGEG